MEDSVNVRFKFTTKVMDKWNEINHFGGQKEQGGLLRVVFQIYSFLKEIQVQLSY